MTIARFLDEEVPLHNDTEAFYSLYEPKETLGTGVSSIVKKCIEKISGHEYAVKILDLNSGSDPADVIRSEAHREINILKHLAGHPNIISLINVFESESYIFLIFELCPNGELFDHLTRVVSLSEKRTRFMMTQIFDAVRHIHSKGVVHRDLKPENILLDKNMNLKIADFGLAVFITDLEELQEVRGTPGYLAPEVLKVGYYEDEPPYGQAVDMWACGVIMYTLLAGSPPFWNRKEHLMLRQILDCRYSFSSPEWEDVTDQAKNIISNLLILNPEKRLTSEKVLADTYFISSSINALGATQFKPQRKFKAVASCFIFIIRLQKQRCQTVQISLCQMIGDPYSCRRLRKLIDGVAFHVYAHWVKKGDEQNRAALFEMEPRCDLGDHSQIFY